MNEAVLRVKTYLAAHRLPNEIIMLPDAVNTAQAAADAIGCHTAQIAKSIIFQLGSEALLIVASGANRVDEQKVAAYLKEPLVKATAKFVKEKTGFVIGGVAPIAHATPLRILLDEDLWRYDTLWTAAGHPKAVFQLTADELLTLTKGEVINIKC